MATATKSGWRRRERTAGSAGVVVVLADRQSRAAGVEVRALLLLPSACWRWPSSGCRQVLCLAFDSTVYFFGLYWRRGRRREEPHALVSTYLSALMIGAQRSWSAPGCGMRRKRDQRLPEAVSEAPVRGLAHKQPLYKFAQVRTQKRRADADRPGRRRASRRADSSWYVLLLGGVRRCATGRGDDEFCSNAVRRGVSCG